MANYSEPIFKPLHKESDLVIKRQSTVSNSISQNQSNSNIVHTPNSISSNRGNAFLNTSASLDIR